MRYDSWESSYPNGFPNRAAQTATVKVVENSTDYSLQNTVQQALFLPTSRDAEYKAKAAIDTLFVRLGDLGSTGVVFVGALLAAKEAPSPNDPVGDAAPTLDRAS